MGSQLTVGQFFVRVVLIIFALAVVYFLWQIVDVLLLAFVGVLLAVFLRTLVALLRRLVPLPGGVAFAIVVVVLLAFFGAIGWFLAPQLSQDFSQLATDVPDALSQLGSQLAEYGWAQEAIDQVNQISSFTEVMPSGGTLFTRITGTFSTALNVVTNLIFVLFTGIFLAANPTMYRKGILQLIPASRRSRMEEVLTEVVATLRWWLLGQFFSMTVIGTLTGVALWLLEMPFALALGIIAGLFEFVPYVGPVATGFLAGLLAFVQSPLQALYVVLAYIAIQQFESNVLTPIVHRYTVSLPPALSLIGVLAMGALFGFVGVLVATPLIAVAIVLVKMVYIEEVLGEMTELPRQLLKT
ncbi:MAG: AI-2E family transporter [Caldilineaceae bacterium]|nr:AI-2E family transporter [Caldilineaceae bacterium]